MKWRYPYDGRAEEVGAETAIDFRDTKDRTIQSAKDDSDINVIVRRFGMTGQIRTANVEPFYGDFSGVDDYQSAMNMLLAAKQSFAELPADVRSRFGNDPALLIDFLHDDANLEEARKLGLCRPQEAPPEPQLVRIVPEVPEAPPGGE